CTGIGDRGITCRVGRSVGRRISGSIRRRVSWGVSRGVRWCVSCCISRGVGSPISDGIGGGVINGGGGGGTKDTPSETPDVLAEIPSIVVSRLVVVINYRRISHDRCRARGTLSRRVV